MLVAAFCVFAAQGYTGATIDAIVQAAGYSKGAFYFHGPGGDDPLWPALLLEFWSHACRNQRVREGVASVARFRRDARLTALQAAHDAGVICPTLRLDHCADLLLTIGDGLIARVGTAQVDTSAAYLPGIVAGVLGITIGPRPVTAGVSMQTNGKNGHRVAEAIT